VQAIEGERWNSINECLKVLIKWLNFPTRDNIWEPFDAIIPACLKAFEAYKQLQLQQNELSSPNCFFFELG